MLTVTSPEGLVTISDSAMTELRELGRLVATSFWGLSSPRIERVETIMSMVPRTPNADHLHWLAGEARKEYDVNRLNPSRVATGILERAASALAMSLGIEEGLPLVVDGIDHVWTLNSLDVEFNTTLAIAGPVLQLAAKIYRSQRTGAWVADEDREWVAGLIQDGINHGLYSYGLWATSMNGDDLDPGWVDSGWVDLKSFLRDTRGTIVLADMMDDRSSESIENDPYIQISPATLGTHTFGPGVTLFDLFSVQRLCRIGDRFDRYEQEIGS